MAGVGDWLALAFLITAATFAVLALITREH